MQEYVEFKHHGSHGNCIYEIQGVDKPQFFHLQARENPKRIDVTYLESLTSLNNDANSTHTLGFVEDGAVAFVLAGDDGKFPYVSSNPPKAWMQAMLPRIGGKTMRQISMVASHDAGMSKMTRYYGGVPHNTLTQTQGIGGQLEAGARFFDIRPFWHRKSFYTGHFTRLRTGGTHHIGFGGTGQKMTEIVKEVNAFTKQYPGELIILDLSHELSRTHWKDSLSTQDWQKLYRVLGGIEDLWIGSNDHLPDDLTTVALAQFIQPGSRSAVLVRIPDHAPFPSEYPDFKALQLSSSDGIDSNLTIANASDPDSEPNSMSLDEQTDLSDPTDPDITPHDPINLDVQDATPDAPDQPRRLRRRRTQKPLSPLPARVFTSFIPAARLPFEGSYSDTFDALATLTPDQLAKLHAVRTTPAAALFRSTWTLTQPTAQVFDIGNPGASIIAAAHRAHRAMFEKLFPACSPSTYPNLLEIDDVHGSSATALALAITVAFALA